MKIVFLSDDFPPQSFGGAGISTYELALGVKKAGHDVYVVTTSREVGMEGKKELDGLKIFTIQSNYHEKWRAYRSLYNPSVLKKLEVILREIRPDIIHANNIHYHLSYHSIKLSKKYAKVVITLRDAMSFSFGKLETKKYLEHFDAKLTWVDQLKQAKKRWNPFRNFLIRFYLSYADRILAVSNALKDAAEQNGIRNITVMHTGINVDEYKTSSAMHDDKTIFFSGRMGKSKGSEVVAKVMDKVQKEFPSVKLITAGSGATWIGREEMKETYAQCDIVIVPSVCFDAFPRTVIEAMASGKTVVGTCYGGASEAIVDGVTGFVTNPLNIEETSTRILYLLKHTEKATSFGQAGLERIKTNFNLKDKVKDHISIYENA